MDRSDSKPAGRQSFYIAPDVMAWVARYGKAQGIVNGKGEAILSKTVETILERFMALEEGGQHVSALVDAHTGPLSCDVAVLRRMVRFLIGCMPDDWWLRWDAQAEERAHEVESAAQQAVNGGPDA